jgi:hypothetical protein
MDACTACSRAVDLISTRLLKRLGENSRQSLPPECRSVPSTFSTMAATLPCAATGRVARPLDRPDCLHANCCGAAADKG